MKPSERVCIVCGLPVYALSMGGPSICPDCDCDGTGVGRLKRLLAEKDKEIEQLKSDLEETDQQNDRLRTKLLTEHMGCACDFDKEGDVCGTHYPAKKRLDQRISELEQRDREATKEFVELGITISNQLERIAKLERENAKLRLRLFDEGRIKESEQSRS